MLFERLKLCFIVTFDAQHVAMGLIASTSLAGVSVHTGSYPCDVLHPCAANVLVHSGAAVATAAPPCGLAASLG
jgi:hypothetical protein